MTHNLIWTLTSGVWDISSRFLIPCKLAFDSYPNIKILLSEDMNLMIFLYLGTHFIPMLRSKRCNKNSKNKDKLRVRQLNRENKYFWLILRSKDWESCRPLWTLQSIPTQISQFLGSWECAPLCPLTYRSYSVCLWVRLHPWILPSGSGSIRPTMRGWTTETEMLPLNKLLGTFFSDIPQLWQALSLSVLACVNSPLALQRTWKEAL